MNFRIEPVALNLTRQRSCWKGPVSSRTVRKLLACGVVPTLAFFASSHAVALVTVHPRFRARALHDATSTRSRASLLRETPIRQWAKTGSSQKGSWVSIIPSLGKRANKGHAVAMVPNGSSGTPGLMFRKVLLGYMCNKNIDSPTTTEVPRSPRTPKRQRASPDRRPGCSVAPMRLWLRTSPLCSSATSSSLRCG